METFIKKQIQIVLLTFLGISAFGQNCDTCAYNFKLDYDIPESPAFSVLDANPSKVMRGSAAKEFALNVANNFISNSRQESGIAADFNPYLISNARFKNINDYRKNDFSGFLKRAAANSTLSFASIQTDQFPNDNLFSGGVRITLFDAADLLYDDTLGSDIDRELNAPDLVWGSNDADTITTTHILNKERFAAAYASARERARNNRGGSLSIGAATSQRGLGGKISADSLMHFRSQVWLSGQYNFGKGLNLLGLAMNRNTSMNSGNVNELLFGVGVRKMGRKVNVGAEVIYSNQKDYLEIGANIEVLLIKNILLVVNVGNASTDMSNVNNQLMIKPTLKYNISE